MQFILPVYLCKKSYSDETNEVGEATESLTQRKVYANEKSAKRNEFYQAQANGYKVEKVLDVRKFEYDDEEIVKIGDNFYTVLKTYDKKDGNIELTLIKGVNQSGST